MPSSELTLGQRIQQAVNDYGIGGFVLAFEGDANDGRPARILTPIYDSEGRPALTEDGNGFACALWEVPINSTHP